MTQPPIDQPNPPAGWEATLPQLPPIERIRTAYQRRHETDYIFDFWSAIGWTILTCGFYGYYVFYQLMRRMRDHNQRRLDLLDGATALAWERAVQQGLSEELRPNFQRIAENTAALKAMTNDFRDPAIWTVLSAFGGGVVHIVAFIFLDQDLVKHDFHEGAIENDLAVVYARLGTPLPAPDPNRLKGKHNYGGRIAATIVSCGFYFLWWYYDMMTEPNRHFEVNWAWEDALAQTVQSMEQAG